MVHRHRATAVSCAALLFGAALAAGLAGCGAKCNNPVDDGESAPPSKGAIEVTSTPAGAVIFLGVSPSGEMTDAIVGALDPGAYTVRVGLTGYVPLPESLVVEVSAGDTASAHFDFDPLGESGSIAVTSDPEGAAIYLDGAMTGSATPDTLGGVSLGAHVVSVDLAGYEAPPETLAVAADSVSDASFTLNLLPTGRVVLIEHFSNTGCLPCEDVDRNIELAIAQLGFEVVVSMANHLNWPYPTDPFFMENSVQFLERRAQFGVNALPQVFIDGVRFDDAAVYSTLKSRIETAAQVDARFEISVSAEARVDSFVVSGTVRKLAETDEGDGVLMAVVIETGISYEAQNGLTQFDDVIRRYLTGTGGEALALAVDGQAPYRFAEEIQGGWNAENLEAVVFVQSASSRKVYQAKSTR